VSRLKEPIPNSPEGLEPPPVWQSLSEKPLPRPEPPGISDFFELLETRHTERQLCTPTLPQVAELLWWTTRTTAVSTKSPAVQRRPMPTAGALGAVETIVVRQSEGAWLYVPTQHSAGILRSTDQVALGALEEAHKFIDAPAGDLLIFVADKPRIAHHYMHGESLALREAGCLLGAMSLASEALGLGFCPLGTLGHVWASRILGVPEELVIAGGAAMVGGR
jgi:SagB-type dehydrogenase family enzyme